MKILHSYRPENSEDFKRTVKIYNEGTNLTLIWDINEDKEDKEPDIKTVTVNLTDYAGGFIDIRCTQLIESNTIVVNPAYTTYSYANRLPSKIYTDWDVRQFCIMVNEDASDFDVLICFPAKEVEGFENVISNTMRTWTGLMTSMSEIGRTNFAKVQKKSKLLGELDNGNSIAYLEAQVDVLTRYVLNKHMNDLDDEELRDILIAANKSSILDIKSKEKLIEEMKHKAHTRAEQLKYYENKE